MLNKLYKHEVKAVSAFAWPILLGIIVAFLLAGAGFGIMTRFDNVSIGVSAVTSISTILLVFGIIVAQVVFEVLLIVRYYTNLMTDEGYLSFTLPVTPTEHICAKLLTVVVFTLLLILADLIGLFLGITLGLLTSGAPLGEILSAFGKGFEWFFNAVSRIFSAMSLDSLSIVLLFVLNVVFGFIFDIFKAYFALTVAGMARKLKFLAGLGVYLGVHYVMNIVNTIIGIIIANAQYTLISTAALSLIGAVVLFFLTKGMLEKKLNLN